MSEILATFLRINLMGGLVILAVLAVRLPARHLFGPQAAYRLWAAPPLAAFASLMPARIIFTGPPPGAIGHWTAALAGIAPALLALWVLGLLAAVGLLWRAQAAFLREARAGRAGPAVVGVICPRIVMPADDGRYTPEERALVRAHEREHIARRDPRAGGWMAAFQCLAWFNPLVHLAVHLARLDQELACDAGVIRRHPGARALYARTLLKTQLATRPLPLGCYWPPQAIHPLEVRIGLLKAARRDEGLAGPIVAAAMAVTASLMAWAAQPPIYRPMVVVAELEPAPTMQVLLLSFPSRAGHPSAAR